MARNRKRARERQRTQPVSARPAEGLSAHGGPLDRAPHGGALDRDQEATGAPDPLEHATPDAELVAAQLALGRPEPDEDDDEIDDDELAELASEAAPPAAGGSGNGGRAGVVARPGAGQPGRPSGQAAERISLPARLVTFLQGSWAELQRVQWPDRRQVMQATGVVVGFVIVAGLYLALSDTVASHLMTWILK